MRKIEIYWLVVALMGVVALVGIYSETANADEQQAVERGYLFPFESHPRDLGVATDPHPGVSIEMTRSGNDVLVKVTGDVEIYCDSLYVYGYKGDKYISKFENGVAKTPYRTWNNLIFKGEDGLWHFLLIDAGAAKNTPQPEPWMGEGTCAMPDVGQGAAFTYCGNIYEEVNMKE